MEKIAIIKRINRDHVEKLRRFNSASEEDKLKFAFDRSFWNAHDCAKYLYEGQCLDCGSAVRRDPVPRRAGVSPSPRRAGVSS